MLLSPGLSTGPDPLRGSGQGGFKMSRVRSDRVIVFKNFTSRVGSGQQVLKSRESGRVGSRGLKSRGSGRVGSCQEVWKSRGSIRVGSRGLEISRVGSGHDPRDTDHSRVKPPWPAGCFG